MTTIDQLRICVAAEYPPPLPSGSHDLFVFSIILWSIDLELFLCDSNYYAFRLVFFVVVVGTQRDEFRTITKAAKRNKNYAAHDQSVHIH